MVMIDDSTFQAVNNNNLKAIGEQPAIYANMALRSAIEAQDALSQLGRSQLQSHQQLLASAQQQHIQSMAAFSQLAAQALAGIQMASLSSTAKAIEDARSMDPKDARAEGLLLDPAIYAGRDLGSMRSFIREEIVAALQTLAAAKPAGQAA